MNNKNENRYREIDHIHKVIDGRFGKTDLSHEFGEATIFFRAAKSDELGRFPAIQIVRFRWHDGKWFCTTVDLPIPILECLRNQCGVTFQC